MWRKKQSKGKEKVGEEKAKERLSMQWCLKKRKKNKNKKHSPTTIRISYYNFQLKFVIFIIIIMVQFQKSYDIHGRSVCLEVKCFRKTFSAFSDIWGAVKSKLTEKVCNLTGKSLCKLRKTVYGKFFHKPFSKMREAFCSLSLLSLLSALCTDRRRPFSLA